MTDDPDGYHVNEEGQCTWGCYGCKHTWQEDRKYRFSYCPNCQGGDTGVKLKSGEWIRFKLHEWEVDGKSPWE